MRVPVPFSAYGSTRHGVDQKRVNLYPHSDGGLRQFPGLTQFGTASAVSVQELGNFDTSTDVTGAPNGVDLSPDGTKMLVTNGSNLFSFTLATPFSASTAVYDSLVSTSSFTTLAGESVAANDMKLSPDGGTLMILDSGPEIVFQFSMSTPFNPATLAYVGKFDMSALFLAASGFDFNLDGTKMIVIEQQNSSIHSFTLDAWTITTAEVVAGDTLDVSGQISTERACALSSDELTVYAVGQSDDIYSYTMTAKCDLSTATYDGAGLGLTLSSQVFGMRFRNGDRRFYIADRLAETIDEYLSGAAGRGAINMGGVLYIVTGPTLYSVSSVGARTSIGTIADAPNLVGMETDGTQLIITTGSTVYKYTVAGGLVENTDADLDESANTSAYLDQRFYYDQPNGQFVASSLTDAIDIDALDFATAESFNDNLVAVYGHNQLLYLFGETSIEPWYTSGSGRPPVDRQAVIERGLIGKRAVTSIDNRVYFMDHARRINVMSGLEYQPIDVPGLDDEIANYDAVSDVVFNTYTLNRENFLEVFFVSEDTSWTMHEKSGQWTKREDVNGNQFNAIAYVNVYGKLIALDHSNGKLYEMSSTTYQDDGSNITRTVDSVALTAEALGSPGRGISVDGAHFTVEASAAASATLSVSKDGGDFTSGRTMTIPAGVSEVSKRGCGIGKEVILRISTTSNAKVDFVGLAADVELLSD